MVSSQPPISLKFRSGIEDVKSFLLDVARLGTGVSGAKDSDLIEMSLVSFLAAGFSSGFDDSLSLEILLGELIAETFGEERGLDEFKSLDALLKAFEDSS